ncbi:MAG: tRNA lysidine(34) synthetase TilS [Yoonia sp.]|uniref:tRNA lysidine(34) synthetase TilS n=1 Tax=Yoonia sp. TaxID=2212373 RepID=UPI003EF61DD3
MQLVSNLAAGVGWALPFKDLPDPIGIAVSGGGDSMGLLHIMHTWAVQNDRSLLVATVDHGLRDGSRAEAEFVAQTCADFGVPHTILTWDRPPSGNLQSAARTARYDLLSDWAKANELSCVLLGHTSDDSAETFLMRLARGSGVDGLAKMQDHRWSNGVLWIRPLLDTSRAAIRAYLKERECTWVEDPSNDDDRFDRVKARAALAALAPLGLTSERLNDTGFLMSIARDALEATAADVAKDAVAEVGGDIVIDLKKMTKVPFETQLRIMTAGVCCVSSNRYRPRLRAMTTLYNHHHTEKPRTVHGTLVTGDRDSMRIAREYNAVKHTACAIDQIWDGRWAIDGPRASNLTIRALGEHINVIADWRETGLPRASLMASPAVFDGETLVSAPIAGLKNGFSARIVADYMSFLLSR